MLHIFLKWRFGFINFLWSMSVLKTLQEIIFQKSRQKKKLYTSTNIEIAAFSSTNILSILISSFFVELYAE